MRVRTFQGGTLEEILPEIRAELGPDAVVLTQRQLVTGGIGGFFGKRVLEVTAADRMPSDAELVDLEDRQGWGREETASPAGSAVRRGRGSSTAGSPARAAATAGDAAGAGRSRIDVRDDWDPSQDEELADEYGGVLQRAMEAVAQAQGRMGEAERQQQGAPEPPVTFPTAADAPPPEPQVPRSPSEAVAAAAAEAPVALPAPGGGDRRLQTTPYGRASRTPPAERQAERSGGRVRAAADADYEPMALPQRARTIESPALGLAADARQLDDPAPVDPGAGAPGHHRDAGDGWEPHSQDGPHIQARKLAARAHNAIAQATHEIEQQLAYDRTVKAQGAPQILRAEVLGTRGAHADARLAAEAARYDLVDGSLALDPAAQSSETAEAPRRHVTRPAAAVRGVPSPAALALAESARTIEAFLADTGVDEGIAQAVVAQVVNHRLPFSAAQDVRELVRHTIAESIRVTAGWPLLGRTHRIALVGSSGAGKSSVAAKLAEGYSRGAGLSVGVVSVLARGELPAQHELHRDPLLQRPELDVRLVAGPEQMAVVLDRMADRDLVIIDTPSSAYLDREATAHLHACLVAAAVDEVHGVVPLATSLREAESVVEHFRPLGLDRLVVSKLDESRYAGQLLNFGFRFGLPITFVADGPRVPEDLRAASAADIAGLILPHDDAAETSISFLPPGAPTP